MTALPLVLIEEVIDEQEGDGGDENDQRSDDDADHPLEALVTAKRRWVLGRVLSGRDARRVAPVNVADPALDGVAPGLNPLGLAAVHASEPQHHAEEIGLQSIVTRLGFRQLRLLPEEGTSDLILLELVLQLVLVPFLPPGGLGVADTELIDPAGQRVT